MANLRLGETRCGSAVFKWGARTYIMGVINVTPDSFSGDGLSGSVDSAVALAKDFAAAGADVIDVGGESSRPPWAYPGATPVSLDEELRRVMPVIQALVATVDLPIRIDTYKAEVARRAIEAGAAMVNDVWALEKDPDMAAVVAQKRLWWHKRGFR
ncbi:MAG: dihydropteroate synthase/2-amino-4-hydroxy-6-hydroxymethyldihydropteridine diphosphokinase [Dehalococcoidia bacterium]|nr:dihydropteroate synthase/2-amino-4-hydroxy-6-hydroxymethyldihydropteridine diphosphokinase [Dehalococcoidia bacterium]